MAESDPQQAASNNALNETEKAIQLWKVKRSIQMLNSCRGNGTSLISLILPPNDQVTRVSKMLNDELGTASNIKSRVTRLAVLGAITSVLQRLKLYNRVPKNGLIIYCGTILTTDGKEKKVNIDIEPFKPINTSLYMCDNKFHTQVLSELLESDEKFGFIVMDGSGALFGTLSGNTREVIHQFNVELPKKHGRGGQSSVRFARLRLEKRHNYLRKVAEMATQFFITNDRPNVSGLVLAGSAEFKTKLSQSEMFDPRLAAVVIKVVDISYGGENGFNQAIELAGDALKNVRFIREKELLAEYFSLIAQDSGKFCFGVKDTVAALQLGAVETLILWENLPINRLELLDPTTNAVSIKYLTDEQERDASHFQEPKTGAQLELKDKMPLLEWLTLNFTKFGAKMEFVTDRSQEGSQFCRGFGGIGGILRYKLNFDDIEQAERDDHSDEEGKVKENDEDEFF